MTKKKFKNEIDTLNNLFHIYCKNHHLDLKNYSQKISFQDSTFLFNSNLCVECQTLFEDATLKIKECKHDEKPKCRKCPNPCYEKANWKQIAKIMRYAGINSGLKKVKKLFHTKK